MRVGQRMQAQSTWIRSTKEFWGSCLNIGSLDGGSTVFFKLGSFQRPDEQENSSDGDGNEIFLISSGLGTPINRTVLGIDVKYNAASWNCR